MEKRENIHLLSIICIWIIFIAFISLSRNYFSYGTENDFLGGFMPEAERLLSGQALSIEFHPPFYAFVLAIFQLIFDDWFLSGRILSLASYAITLFTSYYFFKYVFGNLAGWGALFALMASEIVVGYSILATSDIFFYALYSTTLFLAVLAYRNNSFKYWMLCGVFVGLVMLTRTNGFTLLSLMLLPWITNNTTTGKSRISVFLLAGIAAPLLLWTVIAAIIGSPTFPHGTYANLALTYFSPVASKLSGEARMAVEAQFQNLWQVLAYDPLHIVKTYIKDLIKLAKIFMSSNKFIDFPLYLFLAPGVILLLLRANKLIFFYLFVITLSQLLLVNFKGYENRLYIFMVPLYGVALATCCKIVIDSIQTRFKTPSLSMNTVFSTTLILALMPTSYTAHKVYKQSQLADQRLHESVMNAKEVVLNEAWVVARNPQIPFYTNGKSVWFPNVKTYDELKLELSKLAQSAPVYIYYGQNEKKQRPAFENLATGNTQQSPWLTSVRHSKVPGEWVLYKYTDF